MPVRVLDPTALRTLPDPADSLVTLPPCVPQPEAWTDVARALKPGAHALVLAAPSTHDLITLGLRLAGFEIRDLIAWLYDDPTAPLQPALTPIVVARCPLEGTVAQNVLTHGTGALHIDACRVPHITVEGGNLALNPHLRASINGGNGGNIFPTETERRVVMPHSAGRWPANVIHDGSERVLDLFPTTSSGTGAVKRSSSKDGAGNTGAAYGAESRPAGTPMICYGDTGSAARFFHTVATAGDPCPLPLLRYLVRLVTPPGGTVLDPFAATDRVGQAATEEGCAALLVSPP